MRLILMVLALVAVSACDRQKAENPQGNEPAAVPTAELQKGLDRSRKGTPAPATVFQNPDGGDISLASFKGTPVAVNLWATWCAPCVKELPTLDALAAKQAASGALGVVAVSQDMGPQNSVKAFLDKLKTPNLAAYHDPKMALSAGLGADILPTTILFDADGREVWRYVGDFDWNGAEAAKLLAEAGGGAAG